MVVWEGLAGFARQVLLEGVHLRRGWVGGFPQFARDGEWFGHGLG